MSELIDRIFDVEKISADVNVILQNLQKITSEINSVKEAVKSNEAEIRKSKSTDQLSEATKKLNDNVVNGGRAMKTWQDEVAKLQEKTKQLTDTEKQASIEIAKARLELQAAKKATKDQAIAEIELAANNGKVINSYKSLERELKETIDKYKSLDIAEQKNADGRSLLRKINETQKILSKTDAAMGNYQRNVGNYASALQNLGLSTNVLGSRFGFLTTKLGVWGIAAGAVVGAGAALVKNSMQLEKTLSEVEAVTGATSDEMVRLRDNAVNVGSASLKTAEEVAQLQVELGKLGFTVPQIENMTSAITDLSVATGENMAKSAEVLGSTMRSMGKSAFESGHVADVMAQSFNASALDLDKFSESFKYVGAVARTTDTSLEETTAMLALLSNNGISGSNAGTALRMIMLKLAEQSGTLTEKITKLQKEGLGLADANDEVGQRAMTALLILAQQSDMLPKLTENFKSADGAVKKMADVMSDNLSGSLTLLSSKWDAFMLSLENGKGWLSTATRSVVDFFGSVVEGLTSATKSSEQKQNELIRQNTELRVKSYTSMLSTIQGTAKKINDINSEILAEKNISKGYDDRINYLQEEIRWRKNLGGAWDKNNDKMQDEINGLISSKNKSISYINALGGIKKQLNENTVETAKNTKETKDNSKEILEASRRLEDSKIALMEDGMLKEIEINRRKYERQIEDLKATGALKYNLTKQQQNDEQKIKKEWQSKKINDEIKADELVLENLKKSGADTLAAEKELLNKRIQAEILAGGDEVEIRKKYKYLLIDVEKEASEKKYKAFEDQLKKDIDALTENYRQQESVIKKQYADGIISREEYENKVKNLRDEAEQAANTETIKLLTAELNSAEISADKRAELSKRIADLTIANENAVVDATIAANEEKLKSDAEAAEKRKQIAEQLIGASMELFSAIGEFQAQESERRIAEYEKEQSASDASFEKQQENLDNAIMSDETRAQKQKEIDEDKAANDKRIADKIQAEKIRQAKWSKAQSITEAIINTAGSIATTSKNLGFPLAIPFIALAAATGALQVATIAKQPIAAYEKGGITSSEVALWGEKRPEVAVTTSGEAFLATKPTISKFDAGTKIYKDVSDYERAIASKSLEKFTFDYDKMAGKIPQNSIVLDSRGLWGIVSRQNRRSTLINRRYKI